jgi:ceramide glucosyltransferase
LACDALTDSLEQWPILNILRLILLGCASASIATTLWQWIAGLRFPIERIPAEITRTGKEPSITLLKPLKGRDSETEDCLESWFQQEYSGGYQLLFGVASLDDPVCEIVRRLLGKYPNKNGELVLCSPLLGTNAKVSSLCHLSKRVRNDLIIVSDDDVFIQRNFLHSLMTRFCDPRVGLISCLYMVRPKTLGMRFEAIAVNADFWTQVLQGLRLKPMDFALGAVMVIRKELLEQTGGFESLLDYLADDYQLGNRIGKTGAKLEICNVPVECRTEAQSARQVWNHQLRWARTIRVCQPLPYFLSILSNTTLWPLLAALFEVPNGVRLVLLSLVLRILTATWNYRKLTGVPALWAGLMAPMKDVLAAVIWGLSFSGNKIVWRGLPFRVGRGGKLTPIA